MKRQRPEAKIQAALKEYLQQRGWGVYQTHGSAYQSGFPDLFIAHHKFGCRWIDVKVKGRYSFTKAQKRTWPEWERHGVGIWILTAADAEQYDLLFSPPNWRNYWRPSWGNLPSLDDILSDLNNDT